MQGRLRTWLREQVEIITLSAAILLTTALVVWWGVFLRGAVIEIAQLSNELNVIKYGADSAIVQAQAAAIDARHDRWLAMLIGESALFGILLAASVSVLFVLARRRLRQREQLEEILQTTSHEFKTPIAGVKALLQSLAIGSVPPERRDELVQLGLRECERLEHLAETMLANQRAASRELSLDATHAADVLVQEVLAHRATAGISESIVREHIAPATVRADRDAVRVIIENLLDNARKYGGARMRIRAECSVDRWALSVSDAGSGFAPRDADALFDPFARNSRTGATHGSGLGLTISRQLARKMGGDLEASSEGPGQGATFTLSLPLADRRTAAAVATQARHA